MIALCGGVNKIAGDHQLDADLFEVDATGRLIHRPFVPPLPLERTACAVVWHGGALYAMSAHEEQTSSLETVDRYALGKKWRSTNYCSHKPSFASAAVVDDAVYLIGGSYKTVAIAEVEEFSSLLPEAEATSYSNSCHQMLYHSDTNAIEWKQLHQKMIFRRHAHASIVCRGVLFVCGGYDGIKYLRSCEMNSNVSDGSSQWQRTEDMVIPRSSFNLVVVGDDLYAVGGDGWSATLLTIEKRDWRTGEWSIVTTLEGNKRGCAAAAVSTQRKIYVLGGGDSADTWDSYDVDTNKWASESEDPSQRVLPRSVLYGRATDIPLAFDASLFRAPSSSDASSSSSSNYSSDGMSRSSKWLDIINDEERMNQKKILFYLVGMSIVVFLILAFVILLPSTTVPPLNFA